jgi:hypothetical protein
MLYCLVDEQLHKRLATISHLKCMSRNESQHVVRAIRERVDDMHVGVRSLDTEDALAVFFCFFFYFKIIFF